MNKEKIVCKIYFYDTERNRTETIMGIVNKSQLFSQMNNFIEVMNYTSKTISKNDVERVIVYEKYKEFVITKKSLEVNNPLRMEG